MTDRHGLWGDHVPVTVGRDEIALSVGLSAAELDRKRRALAGHASQTEPLAALLGEDAYRAWSEGETFRRPRADELQASTHHHAGWRPAA